MPQYDISRLTVSVNNFTYASQWHPGKGKKQLIFICFFCFFGVHSCPTHPAVGTHSTANLSPLRIGWTPWVSLTRGDWKNAWKLHVEYLCVHHLTTGFWLTFVFGEFQAMPGFVGFVGHFISLWGCFLIDKLKIETSETTGYFLAG